MKNEKKTFEQAVNKLRVEEIIKNAKTKGIIKPLTEAFDKTPVENEKHKGNANYFFS